MTTYLALMFCKQEDLRAFGKEVLETVRAVAGTKFKYAEGTAHVVAIGFVSDKDWPTIARAFDALWRAEQRCWVIPLPEDGMVIDKAIMEWARRV